MKKMISMVLAVLMLVGCAAAFASCKEKKGMLPCKELIAVGSQLDALNGLLKGDADIAVIDSVMADYYMKENEAFQDYQVLAGAALTEETYGVGARKGSDALIGKINEALIALADTDYKSIAAAHGLATGLPISSTTANPKENATDSSWDDVVAAKSIVIGYTEFAPMAYHNGDGVNADFVGFDIELAEAVIAYLNATYSVEIMIEFALIDWSRKEALLEDGTIDLVWNGMTVTEERSENMAISIPYLANKQVAVVAKADAAKYGDTKASLIANASDAVVIVEKGSVGEEIVSPAR